MVIFGGSGDLTRRKLVPALYDLSRKRLIPGGFIILGLSRSPMTDDEYRTKLKEWVDKEQEGAPAADGGSQNAVLGGSHNAELVSRFRPGVARPLRGVMGCGITCGASATCCLRVNPQRTLLGGLGRRADAD